MSLDEAAAFYWPTEQEDKSKMVMPGDNVEMECEIYHPLALEVGQRFNVRSVTDLAFVTSANVEIGA